MGSVSAGEDTAATDLSTIMEGGENFVARMTAWQQAKKNAEKAQASLNVGQDVRRALDEAKAKREAADKYEKDVKARADALLAKAQKDAADAQALAQATVAQANQQAQAIAENAHAQASQMTAQKAAELDEAKHANASARSLQTAAKKRQDDLQAAIDAAKAAEQAAQDKEAELQRKIDLLANALSTVR